MTKKEVHNCLHHEGIEIRITASEARIKRVEKGLFWIYTLLVANLCTVIATLVMQLVQRPTTNKVVSCIEHFITKFI